jgi:hypothetical protein
MYLTITSQQVPNSKAIPFYIKCSTELSKGIAILSYHLGDGTIIDIGDLLLNVDDNHRVNEWVSIIKGTAEGMVFSYSICPIVGVQGWVADVPFSDNTLNWIYPTYSFTSGLDNPDLAIYLSINSEEYYDDSKKDCRLCECLLLLRNRSNGSYLGSMDIDSDDLIIVRTKGDVAALINKALRDYQSTLNSISLKLKELEC